MVFWPSQVSSILSFQQKRRRPPYTSKRSNIMPMAGHLAQVFPPLTTLLARIRSNAIVYQQLRLPANSELQEKPSSSLWTRHSLYYCESPNIRTLLLKTIAINWSPNEPSLTGISFLSNILLVICSLSGYVISSNRDSDHETRNCSALLHSRRCFHTDVPQVLDLPLWASTRCPP